MMTSCLVPVILGPTGVGKTRVAFELALALGGEIVVADSRQVYRDLSVGSNQPGPELRGRVRYHLLEVADPHQPFSLGDYLPLARAAIHEVAARGHLPIVEGGSMLYVQALCDGSTLGNVPPDPDLRRSLQHSSAAELRAMLEDLDPNSGVDLSNPPRMIRAIELLRAMGPPLTRLRQRQPPPWRSIPIGLYADPNDLVSGLEERSRQMVADGLVAETAAALAAGVRADSQALTGIGYREAVAYLQGALPEADLVTTITRSTRRYARRQLSWWRRDPNVTWFGAAPGRFESILQTIKDHLI
ncbi:MAG TPA: tRNA (adenosine(37)-N6)-dimethylallyltransferase MiaA [Candidatus Acidoferrales bacterium]|nr:tRNA (adenosine(37)-N6)-dimethylallyltransferase MiaA [Candidatus Acidoferrales bacterium]